MVQVIALLPHNIDFNFEARNFKKKFLIFKIFFSGLKFKMHNHVSLIKDNFQCIFCGIRYTEL